MFTLLVSDAQATKTYCVDAAKVGGEEKLKVTQPSIVVKVFSSVLAIKVLPLPE